MSSAIAEVAQGVTYQIVKVRSLKDQGPGTLRDCVEKPFPRVCIFEVSGRIRLSKALVIDRPDLVIAGQTAPSPGILITNAGIAIQSRNVTIEHIAVRAGDSRRGPKPMERDSVSVKGSRAHSVTLKNLSISWAIDENVSTYGPVSNVRFENCIIAEALHRSLHPKGPHSMGALVGESARNVSFVGNLFAANYDRNVRWKYDTTGEMVGNVIYGWGGSSSWNTTNISDLEATGRPILLDIIGNVYLPGPSGFKNAFAIFSEATPPGSRIYVHDNLASSLTNLGAPYISPQRVVGISNQTYKAADAFDIVLNNSGARPWDRNEIDRRIVDGVIRRTLTVRDNVDQWPRVARNVRKFSMKSDRLSADELSAILTSFNGF